MDGWEIGGISLFDIEFLWWNSSLAPLFYALLHCVPIYFSSFDWIFFVALCLDFWNPSNWILFVLSPCYCSFDLIPFSLFSSSAYMDEWKWSEVGCHFFVEGFFLFFFFLSVARKKMKGER